MAKITIFGLAGTGTSSAGKLLAKKIHYTFLSTGMVFRKKAESLGLDLYQFEALCNGDSSYDRAVDMEIKKFGESNDNFVVESRLGWHFIPDSYKIKFICDFNVRLQRVVERDRISEADAEKKTIFREESHAKRFKEYYQLKEFAPDSAFDLIIDTTTHPLEKVIDRIIVSLKDRAIISYPL